MPHTALLTRIRGEYLEMPGLRLTLQQAQRLWGVERTACEMMLAALVEAKFLCVRPDGSYARVSDGMQRPAAATERLSAGKRT
jgi:hypothetical protein